jgi:S-adenosylmethionine-dependent methyltransferase
MTSPTVAEFKALQQLPWNRLRYEMALTYVQRHLDAAPLTILDAGGGNGLEAIRLTQIGHRVTLLDRAADMLADARAGAAAAGVAEHMQFVQAEVHEIPTQLPTAAFDAVLCHNVLQYVDDLESGLRSVLHPLRAGGIVSILGPNRYSEPYRLAFQEADLDGALQQLDRREMANRFYGVTMNVHAAEEMSAALLAVGCVPVADYGIRCVMDYLADNERKAESGFFAALLQLEVAMGERHPYKLLARQYQVLARKTGG